MLYLLACILVFLVSYLSTYFSCFKLGCYESNKISLLSLFSTTGLCNPRPDKLEVKFMPRSSDLFTLAPPLACWPAAMTVVVDGFSSWSGSICDNIYLWSRCGFWLEGTTSSAYMSLSSQVLLIVLKSRVSRVTSTSRVTRILPRFSFMTGQNTGSDAHIVAKFTSSTDNTAGTHPYQDGSSVGEVAARLFTMETSRQMEQALTLLFCQNRYVVVTRHTL